MSTFPTGVSVVTTVDSLGVPHGFTCSALCSLSLEPPMLLVCVRNGSRTLTGIQERAMFAVNLLHDGGREAAGLFSSDVVDRFERIAWAPSAAWALPCLFVHAHAMAECRVAGTMILGDHTIVGGEVLCATRLTAPRPLLYGMRTYASWPDGDVHVPGAPGPRVLPPIGADHMEEG